MYFLTFLFCFQILHAVIVAEGEMITQTHLKRGLDATKEEVNGKLKSQNKNMKGLREVFVTGIKGHM